MATQGSPDLQKSTAKQKSTVCVTGVNKIAPNIVTLVVTYIYVVRLFKDLTAQHIYIYVARRLRVMYWLWYIRQYRCAGSNLSGLTINSSDSIALNLKHLL